MAERMNLFDASPEAFGCFYVERVAALNSQGPIETQFAERITVNAWRFRRAYRIESRLFGRARTEQTCEIDLVFLRLSTSGGDEQANSVDRKACVRAYPVYKPRCSD
jgi:hypothetical protein